MIIRATLKRSFNHFQLGLLVAISISSRYADVKCERTEFVVLSFAVF